VSSLCESPGIRKIRPTGRRKNSGAGEYYQAARAEKSWNEARLGEDHGRYSFRTWEAPWIGKTGGRYTLAVRATDDKGNVQPDEPVWNPGGYLWNKIERQEILIGKGS
jgi:hypothetical protein